MYGFGTDTTSRIIHVNQRSNNKRKQIAECAFISYTQNDEIEWCCSGIVRIYMDSITIICIAHA